jgi:hypothetical protein
MGVKTWYPMLGKMVLAKIPGPKREEAAGYWRKLQ